MRRTPWAMYLWPGLPQLWQQGSWSGLTVALGLASLLNLALVGSFGWSELFPPGVRNALWIGFGAAWLAAAVFGPGPQWPQQGDEHPQDGGNFGQALDYYLKGNWFQAERVLSGMLRQNARDLDARLMLATLLRHTGRFDEADRQLDLLERLEGSSKWELEMRRERELLAEARIRHAAQAEDEAGLGAADSSQKTMQAA